MCVINGHVASTRMDTYTTFPSWFIGWPWLTFEQIFQNILRLPVIENNASDPRLEYDFLLVFYNRVTSLCHFHLSL